MVLPVSLFSLLKSSHTKCLSPMTAWALNKQTACPKDTISSTPPFASSQTYHQSIPNQSSPKFTPAGCSQIACSQPAARLGSMGVLCKYLSCKTRPTDIDWEFAMHQSHTYFCYWQTTNPLVPFFTLQEGPAVYLLHPPIHLIFHIIHKCITTHST